MKRNFRIFCASALLLSIFMLAQPKSAIGQPFPPPPPDTHGATGNMAPGGTAPIDGGLSILIFSALAFGAHKFYRTRKLVKS